RLVDAANLHLDGNRNDDRARELDVLALDRSETRQVEGQRVDAGPQIDDAVLPGTVGDGRPGFLDERRARGLDSHGAQYRAGRVTNGSRKGRLREHRCGEQKDDEGCQRLRHSSHTEPLLLPNSRSAVHTELGPVCRTGAEYGPVIEVSRS